MGKESVLTNDASAKDLVRCPKCGHQQEPRVDCKKCGIVFSKYLALYPSARPGDTVAAGEPVAPESGEIDLRAAVGELQVKTRVLQSKLTEVEFERAERSQLRAEFKNLERKLEEQVEGTTTRLRDCEQRLESVSALTLRGEVIDCEIPAIHDRLEQLEERLAKVEFAWQLVMEIRERQEDVLGRLRNLETRAADMCCQIEEFRSAAQARGQSTPLEEDVHAIRENLEEFRRLLRRES